MSAFTFFSTPNMSSQSAYCPHCDNHGLVVISVLDNEPVESEFAAPCPMCERGGALNSAAIPCNDDPKTHAKFVARSSGPWEFWPTQRVFDAAWSHGYTTEHKHRCTFQAEGRRYPCGLPARDRLCEYHIEAGDTGVGAVAFSIPRLAQLASQVPVPKEAPKRRVLTPQEKRRLAEVIV